MNYSGSIGEKESCDINHCLHNDQISFNEGAVSMCSEELSMNISSEETFSQDSESSHQTYQEDASSSQGESAKYHAHRQMFDKFLVEIEKLPDPEAKLQLAIDFMEASLAQTNVPHFKSFWEARNICLQLFKENISPGLRGSLWTKYNELSKEAKRLKEILDEQSAFAVEQIEIAVKALEDDIHSFDEQLQKMQSLDLNVSSQALEKHLPLYQQLQRELNLLNTQAARINALRKELIRTEMRIRQKNKFFQRLSVVGDKVFPRRKELIKEVSQTFSTDVDAFILKHFEQENFHDSLFSLREEIKALQAIAKTLTLNTHSFTHTRMRLSNCWDQVKNAEKERKKERVQQKALFKQNYDDALQKIQEFSKDYEAHPTSFKEALGKLDEVSSYIRGLELGRDEVRELKEHFNEARKPILEKQHAEEQERRSHEQEQEKLRRQKVQEIKSQIEQLINNNEDLDAEKLASEREVILQKINESSLSKIERQEFDRQLKPLRDLISERKEKSLLALSEDDRESLQQLKEILKQRKDRRQEIKDQLKKAGNTSGLDIAQAMNYNVQIQAEKERLEKINLGIKEIEQKIAELEG